MNINTGILHFWSQKYWSIPSGQEYDIGNEVIPKALVEINVSLRKCWSWIMGRYRKVPN